MNIEIITTQTQLENFCSSLLLQLPEFVCIDTEFIRQRTYWPELALIQIAYPGRALIIDPLVNNLQLDSLLPVLMHKKIIKVFHSGRQDLEIFWHLFRKVPKPVFDTQIAAAFLGIGEGISYERLIHTLLEEKLDKTHQFTEWLKRPLNNDQLKYALNDVIFLCSAYSLILKQLKMKGRTKWLRDELAFLERNDTYCPSPSIAWRRIKHQLRSWRQLSILKDLARWREIKARKLNISRSILLEDRFLVDVSKRLYLTEEEIQELLPLYKQQIISLDLVHELSNAINIAYALVKDEGERGAKRHREMESTLKNIYPRTPAPRVQELIDTIRSEINQMAHTLGVPSYLLADKHDIKDFASTQRADHKLLAGWRGEVLKEALQKFVKEAAKDDEEEIIT